MNMIRQGKRGKNAGSLDMERPISEEKKTGGLEGAAMGMS